MFFLQLAKVGASPCEHARTHGHTHGLGVKKIDFGPKQPAQALHEPRVWKSL